MKSATAACSTRTSYLITGVITVDAPASSTTSTYADDIEIGVPHIEIIHWNERRGIFKRYDKWVWVD
jgi:hypothetical protein